MCILLVPLQVADIASAQTAQDGIISISEICERLGITVSSDLLTRLGFVPSANINNEKLYRAIEFKSICDALEFHIGVVRDMK